MTFHNSNHSKHFIFIDKILKIHQKFQQILEKDLSDFNLLSVGDNVLATKNSPFNIFNSIDSSMQLFITHILDIVLFSFHMI